MKEIYITTEDNPYNPEKDWEKWLTFDHLKGYNTCEALSTHTIIDSSSSEKEIEEEVEQAINKLIELGAIDSEGNKVNYKKIVVEK